MTMQKFLMLALFLAASGYGVREVWERMQGCVADVRADVMSPNKIRRAVLYNMDCEATTGLDTHAALMPLEGEVQPERQPPFFVLDGSHDVALSWENDRTLIVTLPPGPVDVHQQEDFAGPVRIVYRRQ